ncbi:hypothetical protein PROFUN_08726 [Planoprotostelium fungivorum]|uniref:Uncharacterized protein n=1 Tax=Planoprotostelium fungivorum TaxID=1890364 RepID=A0A2P6ND64_9EUKA|nr:hypothetical protein PROFUN_08726 [Planoprotostelium fungivorum]
MLTAVGPVCGLRATRNSERNGMVYEPKQKDPGLLRHFPCPFKDLKLPIVCVLIKVYLAMARSN